MSSSIPFSLVLAAAFVVYANSQDERPASSRTELRARCVQRLVDQATGDCLHASSVPTLGHLYPLGPELNVDPAGQVGIGTTSPSRTLDVAGTVRAQGGIEFPDGSVQTTASQPNAPKGVLGTGELVGISNEPFPIYSLSQEILFGGATPNISPMTLTRDVDADTWLFLDAARTGAQLADLLIVIDDLELRFDLVSVSAHETVTVAKCPPREKVTFAASLMEWKYQNVVTCWDWVGNGGGGTAWDAVTPIYVVPEQDGVVAGETEVRSISLGALSQGGPGFVAIEKSADILTPTEIYAVMTEVTNPSVVAIHRPFDSSTGQDEVLEKITISDAQVVRTLLERDGGGGLLHTIELSGSMIEWEFVAGQTVEW